MSRVRIYLWIALGGAIGAITRYAVLSIVDITVLGHGLPALFIVNISGSFLLGLFFALVAGRRTFSPPARAFVSVGLLGGFTTYSFLNYESMTLMLEGAIGAGLLNATGSVLAGLVAAVGGMMLGRLVFPAQPASQEI